MQDDEKKDHALLSDIARRFEVPERKAKLVRFMSESGKPSKKMTDSGLPVYCICKSPDIERFMIMCDQCEEWFHGDCIKITEDEAKHIKYFYCKSCRCKDPFLKIKYRKNKKKEEREHHEKKRQKEKKLKLKKKSESSEVHKSASAPALSIDSFKKTKRYETDEPWKLERERPKKHERKNPIRVHSSDSEDNDVGITITATDKNGGSSSSRNQSVAEFSKDEITAEAEETRVNASDEIKVNVDGDNPESVGKETSKEKKESKRCKKCENCLRKEDCGVCDVCFDKERFGFTSKSQKCRLRRCLNKKSSKKLKKMKLKAATKRRASPVPSASDDEKPTKESKPTFAFLPQDIVPMASESDTGRSKQCYGPGCTNAAVSPSKYCSEDCGRRLARSRLYQILPQRIQDWNNTPTIANELGKAELERIRTRMLQARKELTALEQKFRKLELIISTGKSLSVDERRPEADDDSELESDHSIYCVVCGHSVSLKSAVKHMDKCYIKIESLMSFGSVYPTRIEGSQRLFCDVFNEQQQTYCKRLQVLCPEHTKEAKVTENEVCGCPLSCNVYGENPPTKSSHFCRLAKRKCNKHFKWETMYRAEVDLQRIRQWLKIDEIFDEERRIKTAMSNRAGVVSLLLHQTTVHDPSCVDMRTKPAVTKKPSYKLLI